MSTFFQARAYLRYWLDAVDDHSLHSPFLFDFYQHVFQDRPDDRVHYTPIESIRKKFLVDNTRIEVKDLGAGSRSLKSSQRSLQDIASTGLTPARYSRLYDRLIRFAGATRIVELGTSLGINTLYLASNPSRIVYTLEGSDAVATRAQGTFNEMGRENIRIIRGNIDHTLPVLLDKERFDFAMIDANHTKGATLSYFNSLMNGLTPRGVMVIDDIHLSEEMEQAWNEIKNNPRVYTSLDLYRCGVLFFDHWLPKHHVVLR